MLLRGVGREDFTVEAFSVAEAVEQGRRKDGPVLLLELSDCAGGGAASDSIALVAGLLGCGAGQSADEMCISMCVDPEAAAAAVAAGEGARLTLKLGHALDPKWGTPLEVEAEVKTVAEDGRFTYTGGPFGGTETSMGPSAVVTVGGNVHVLVMDTATYDWADEQYLRMVRPPARPLPPSRP